MRFGNCSTEGWLGRVCWGVDCDGAVEEVVCEAC